MMNEKGKLPSFSFFYVTWSTFLTFGASPIVGYGIQQNAIYEL
jgi:hypothetical protein